MIAKVALTGPGSSTSRAPLGRWAGIYVAVAIAVGGVILTGDAYYHLIAIYICINALLALSLQLLFGFAGQISFAQAAFYGIGAYGAAILMTELGWGFAAAAFVAAIIAAVVAAIVGTPTLRLRGHYLAIATLAMQVAISQFFIQASGITGGTVGIFSIPGPALPGIGTPDAEFLVVVAAVATAAYTSAAFLLNSKFGRQMLAVREDETAAQSLSIPARRVKVIVFALSAFVAAVGGAFYASYIGFISPVTFSIDWSIAILAMVVIGGLGRLSGAALGAILITGVNQVLYVAGRMEFLIFGSLIIIVLILLPRGVAGGLADLSARLFRRDSTSPTKPSAASRPEVGA